MGLDIVISSKTCEKCGAYNEMFNTSITHNLSSMARACGAYDALWGIMNKGEIPAGLVLQSIRTAWLELRNNPDEYEELNPKNGWGSINGFCEVLKDIVEAIEENPGSVIETMG